MGIQRNLSFHGEEAAVQKIRNKSIWRRQVMQPLGGNFISLIQVLDVPVNDQSPPPQQIKGRGSIKGFDDIKIIQKSFMN